MTSKTSLFNKGIYKSTVRRYLWGSVLYAIILFMVTSLVILLGIDKTDTWYRMSDSRVALILDEHYLFLPMIIGCFVPTVVALLVYRFVHSKKTSVFVHSLPVSRTANYISTILAAFTLMAAPIVLNGIILALLSIFGYGEFFGITSCLIWTGANLLTIFLMFSISTFVAMLTGNSFAMVGLNGLIHCIVIIFAAAFSALASCFLYGYFDVNELLYKAMEWNFVAYLMEIANDFSIRNSLAFDFLKLAAMIVMALPFYVFGWLLYKKRRMETAEDVAAFNCLNPIYKYLITFLAALGTFAIFSGAAAEKPLVPIVFTVVISGVVYFAAEMILKKSFRVWKKYKGYLVFAAAFTAMICVFAFTSFFGYETRIPETEDIESVSIYEYYHQPQMPWISNSDIIEYTQDVHEEMIQKDQIYTVKEYRPDYTTAIHIRYQMKNGKTLVRRYPITESKICEVLEKLYKYDEYKYKVMEVFGEEIGEVYRIGFNHGSVYFNDKEMIEEFYSCLTEDIMSLDYTQLHDHQAWSMNVILEYVRTDDLKKYNGERGMWSTYQNINANYKKTLKWMKENGFWDQTFNKDDADLCILDKEQWKEYTTSREVATASYGNGGTVEVQKIKNFSEITGVERISDSTRKNKIADFVTDTGVRFVPDKEYSYYVCGISNDGYLNILAAFYEDGEELLELIEH
ncbi:MAG: ABC transporter permease [Clostridia bacterium]|nr:ABC transporter permease [Clostridia bacterium]